MSQNIEIVLPDGSTRRLGNNMPLGPMRYSFRVWGTVPDEPVIPRADWPTICKAMGEGPDDPFKPPVHDQDGIGQCNADATTAAGERIRAIAGLPYVQLSAADLYDRINGGADNGSMLEDALQEMTTNGVGTAATCGTIWKRGMHKADAAERRRFVVLECCLCPSFDHVFSAVAKGRSLISGIMWGNADTPNKDGWLPERADQAGGHAIHGFKPAMLGSKFGVWHQQSWGKGWAAEHDNCFVIPEARYKGPVGGWWAIRVMADEGGVVPG